jgi:hypothetical protein
MHDFFTLIKEADPLWLLFAGVLQIATYFFSGAALWSITSAFRQNISFRALIMVSLEQLFVNQFIPSGNVAGDVVVVKAVRRLGVPRGMSMEIFLIDNIAYRLAFCICTLITIFILQHSHNITDIMFGLLVAFFLVQATLFAIMWAVIHHKKIKWPKWLKEKKGVAYLLDSLEDLSKERVLSLRLIAWTTFWRGGIFFLDAVTLFAIMESLGLGGSLAAGFVAFMIASVAGAVTLLPGGIGGFEAGSVAALLLFGIPLGGAIASTLLLRGLTLWIPLIPGMLATRKSWSKNKSPV